MLRIKLHTCGSDIIVAACDSELAGRTFREGKARLFIDSAFYGDEEFPEGELARFVALCTSGNVTGERAVAEAVKLGVVNEKCTIIVEGVPHAIFLHMR